MAKAIGLSEDKAWQVESDLRTIIEAKEIQKNSKRMAAVRKLAKEKMNEMEALTK